MATKKKTVKEHLESLSSKEKKELEKLLDDHRIYNVVSERMKFRMDNLRKVFLAHIKVLIYETGKDYEAYLLSLEAEQMLKYIEWNIFTI